MKNRSLFFILALAAGTAHAHRLSPAFFGLTETAPDTYDVQWKVSISGGLAAVLEPKVPDGCALEGDVRVYVVGEDVRFQHATMRCPGGVGGRELLIDGLAQTQTDVLLRVDYLDGSSTNARLTPSAPSATIPVRPSAFEVVRTYTALGVEHILLGVDHLLFVLALLLLVRGVRRLVATVTAFTLAHSVTLAAATLGFVHVPPAPVEAVIALSILFLASELARRRAGAATWLPRSRHSGEPGPVATRAAAGDSASADLTARFPWLVAFSFGLLHGFGFAGALSEVGVPARAVPLALLFFNVGVEIGQLAFIAAVLALGWLIRRIAAAPPVWWPRVAAYGIGSVSAFWVVERTLAIFA
ncbi:MAG TPA: HupE/UreJ family protein [Gammaproteobacteria bacterium]|nr:HupE/UreJ family protein [Gammaproteobacteria bacterium]